jgi:hypothetical protein
MKAKSIVLNLLLLFVATFSYCQKNHSLTLSVSVPQQNRTDLKPNGRLFIFFNQNASVEPRLQTWPSPGNSMFAKNIDGLKSDKALELGSDGWIKTPAWNLNNIPEGEYYIQVLWDQDKEESNPNAAGNLYSEKQKVSLTKSTKLSFELSNKIAPRQLVANDLVKLVDITSDTLSKWWKKPVHVKASILLPSKYKAGQSIAYPIRYNVSGYGGRYDRINRFVNDKNFMDWWQSDEAPQIINVFLDGEGPFGDSYQMDSDNSGPYGYSLIHEVIPYIEKTYRGTNSAATRFVDGCSTGGWVSLGLQLYYPDDFNGVFSYSPDAIEFEDYQLINIYKDENAFINEYGYLRPVMRETSGEPMLSLKDFIQYENVLGSSNTYLNSGGQFSAHTALYSPKGNGGLPKPLFDPVTGVIDHSVAEYWKKYDFKLYAEKSWPTLGPKLQGKVYVWMGDMDNFYLNVATRGFDKFIKATVNPTSDAEIVFTPMKGHCANYSNKTVLLQMAERIKKVDGQKGK